MAPLTSTLVDDFSTLDSAIWDTFGLITPSINANRLLIQTLADTDPAYAGVSTDIFYSLLESSVFVKVLIGGPQSDSHEYAFAYELDSSNRLVIFNSGGYFAARVLTGGTADDTSVTYNATSHAYWKIAESGGTVTFSTSPDGASWSTLKTFATPAWVDADGASIALTVGHYGETEDDTYAFFDKLNVEASTTHNGAATLSGTSAITPRPLENLVINPSFETDFAAWGTYQHVGGTFTTGRVASSDAPSGSYAASALVNPGFTASSGGISGGGNAWGNGMAITAGETYSMAYYSKALTVPRLVNVLCAWFDGGGSHLSSDGSTSRVNETRWTRSPVLTVTAPPTAAYVYVYANLNETIPADEEHLFDAFMVVKGSYTDATMPLYGDGDSEGWAWSGTDHASTSEGVSDGMVERNGAATLSGSSSITPRTLTNLVTNPSFEVDTSGYIPYPGGGGTVDLDQRADAAFVGSYGVRATRTVGPTNHAGVWRVMAGLPVDKTYVWSAWVRGPVGRSGTIWADWGLGGYQFASNNFTYTGGWQPVSLTFTLPPGSTMNSLYVWLNSALVGEFMECDAALLVEGTTVPAYFDGSFRGTWTGTPHASTSLYVSDNGMVQHNASATLAGSSTLTAAGRVERNAAATLTGTSAIIAPTLGEPTNLVLNPAFEVDTAGWFGAGGAGYTTSVTRTNIGSAGWVARCLCATSGVAYGAIQGAGTSHQIPCTPGQVFGVRARLVAASRVGTKGQVIIFWRNSSNGIISTIGGSTASVGEDSLVIGTAPALAVGFTVCVQTPFADMVNVVAGETADWDKIAAFRVSATDSVTTIPAYFDGAYQGYGWTGTAHLSTSRKRAPLADPTNEIPNPKPTLTGTTYVNSGPTWTRVVDATSPTGTALVVNTVGAVNDPHVYPNPGITLNTNDMYFRGLPGETWTLSAWVKAVDAGSQAAVGTSRPSLSIWYKTTTHTSTFTHFTNSDWQRISVTRTLPTSNLNAFFIRLYCGWNIAGSEVRFAGIRFTKGTDTAYIDGDTAGYGWAGTADSAPTRQLSYIGEVSRNGSGTLSGSSALTAAGVVERRASATFNNLVNIAPNPSMEVNFSHIGGNGVSVVSRSSLDAAVGSWSTKVDCTALYDGVAFYNNNISPHFSMPVTRGGRVSVGAWVKAPAGTVMQMEISERSTVDGAGLRGTGVAGWTANGSWEWKTGSAVVGADCGCVRPKVYQNVTGTRTFYVDGLVVVNGLYTGSYFEQNISADGFVERRAAATLAGSSTLTAAAQVERLASGTLAGDSTAVAAGQVERLASATFAGIGEAVAVGLVERLSSATLSGDSATDAQAQIDRLASTLLSAESDLDADGLLELIGSASLDGVSSIAGIGSFEFAGVATLVGYSQVMAMPQSIGKHMATGQVRYRPSGHVSGSRGGRAGRIKARLRETTFGRVHS